MTILHWHMMLSVTKSFCEIG